MSWSQDKLVAADRLIYRGHLIKVGIFRCSADDACFPLSESIDNNVLVFACRPVWFRRNCPDYRFVEPGGILFHRAGSSIERRVFPGAEDHAYWFAIRPDVFAELLHTHGIAADKIVDAIPSSPMLRLQIASLIGQVRDGQRDSLNVESKTLSMLERACSFISGLDEPNHHFGCRATTTRRRRKVVNKTRAFVAANLSRSIGLDEIACEVGVSTYHLCRTFKAMMGLSIHDYRLKQRLGMVIDRLTMDGPDSLTRLALDAGFSSHSHLTRRFRATLGLPPSSLRNRYRGSCVTVQSM